MQTDPARLGKGELVLEGLGEASQSNFLIEQMEKLRLRTDRWLAKVSAGLSGFPLNQSPFLYAQHQETHAFPVLPPRTVFTTRNKHRHRPWAHEADSPYNDLEFTIRTCMPQTDKSNTSLMAQMIKASACNVGDLGSIPGWGRSSGEGNGNPLQYSCLENSMDGEAWWAPVHGVAKSWTRPSNFTFTFSILHSTIPFPLIFIKYFFPRKVRIRESSLTKPRQHRGPQGPTVLQNFTKFLL